MVISRNTHAKLLQAAPRPSTCPLTISPSHHTSSPLTTSSPHPSPPHHLNNPSPSRQTCRSCSTPTMVGVKNDDQFVTLYVAKLRQAFADQAVFAEDAHLAADRAKAALKVYLLTTPHSLPHHLTQP